MIICLCICVRAGENESGKEETRYRNWTSYNNNELHTYGTPNATKLAAKAIRFLKISRRSK